MCQANNKKQETTHNGGIWTTQSRKIRTLGEKEIYKYLGILEAYTIKQMKMKEKLKKNISGEREN